ncbi:uncharacterized protein FOMMEDRAFT_163153 [Fomitiporia mediterranea MF3/22]|uniref:Uncharacterized protein n=1 Tax=Fomitiporia mediterranea (strain MF3/22) TaxID=694068 RepID=R7SIN8_FOMME|nr:uncharacterized protein FOMMEDRAFT_163153 [Fomitiporia mediterranea MF3/22]EJC97474.1 hypothetical protein FOMMEDRAFT_163153 [Fomitiporia mediterranea MF3/22]
MSNSPDTPHCLSSPQSPQSSQSSQLCIIIASPEASSKSNLSSEAVPTEAAPTEVAPTKAKLQADKRAEKAAAVWSDVVQEVAHHYQALDAIAAQHSVNPEQLKEKVFTRASLKNEQKVNPFNAFVHFKAVQYKEGSV